jgi:hypothetical protein
VGKVKYAKSGQHYESIRGNGGIAPPFLTSELDGDGWSSANFTTAVPFRYGAGCTPELFWTL